MCVCGLFPRLRWERFRSAGRLLRLYSPTADARAWTSQSEETMLFRLEMYQFLETEHSRQSRPNAGFEKNTHKECLFDLKTVVSNIVKRMSFAVSKNKVKLRFTKARNREPAFFRTFSVKNHRNGVILYVSVPFNVQKFPKCFKLIFCLSSVTPLINVRLYNP